MAWLNGDSFYFFTILVPAICFANDTPADRYILQSLSDQTKARKRPCTPLRDSRGSRFSLVPSTGELSPGARLLIQGIAVVIVRQHFSGCAHWSLLAQDDGEVHQQAHE